MSTAVDLTPDELAEAIRELRRVYGTGLAPLRCRASVNLDGRVYEARPLADLPAGAGSVVRCIFCGRNFKDEPAMRAAHVDVHGMRARAEQHVWIYFHPEHGVFTPGPPMDHDDGKA